MDVNLYLNYCKCMNNIIYIAVFCIGFYFFSVCFYEMLVAIRIMLGVFFVDF